MSRLERSVTVFIFSSRGCSSGNSLGDVRYFRTIFDPVKRLSEAGMTETIELALKALEVPLNQLLETALEACARCGICAEACHYYRAEPKVEHIPAYRAEQLRNVYRYEHDFLSRLFPLWTRSKKLDEITLANLTEIAFSQCTLCR